MFIYVKSQEHTQNADSSAPMIRLSIETSLAGYHILCEEAPLVEPMSTASADLGTKWFKHAINLLWTTWKIKKNTEIKVIARFVFHSFIESLITCLSYKYRCRIINHDRTSTYLFYVINKLYKNRLRHHTDYIYIRHMCVFSWLCRKVFLTGHKIFIVCTNTIYVFCKQVLV